MNTIRLSLIFLYLSIASHFLHAQIAVLGTPGGIANEFLTVLTLPSYEVPIGTNRLLLVTVSSDLVPLSVTYGGIPMIAQGGGVNLWALTLGSNMVSSDIGDVVLTVDDQGGTTQPAFSGINAMSFSGVDQSMPLENYQELPIPPSVNLSILNITSNIDDLVYDAIVIGCLDVSQGGQCSSPPDATPDPGQTIQNNTPFNGTVFNGRGATSIVTGAPNVAVGWTFSGPQISPLPGIHLGISIRRAPPPPSVGINTINPERALHITDVMRLEPRETEPSNPKKGDIYFSSITNKLRVYDGTQWQDCW